MKLPKSLDPEALKAQPFPGDLTLRESKVFMKTEEWWKKLDGLSINSGRVEIYFFIDDEPAPDDMEIREWRKKKGARIVIDDGSGGMRVEEKV